VCKDIFGTFRGSFMSGLFFTYLSWLKNFEKIRANVSNLQLDITIITLLKN